MKIPTYKDLIAAHPEIDIARLPTLEALIQMSYLAGAVDAFSESARDIEAKIKEIEARNQ